MPVDEKDSQRRGLSDAFVNAVMQRRKLSRRAATSAQTSARGSIGT